jgi:hypothetical protein
MVVLDLEQQAGYHNSHWDASRGRLLKASTYKDCSTIIVTPAVSDLPAPVWLSWMALIRPMNQQVTPVCIEGAEVGDAYNRALNGILSHPELSNWQYMLTVETDNIPPPDGLLKLIEDIEDFDVVGSLYWTKGEGGMPMCYGRTDVQPRDFVPWMPPPDSVSACNGLGMGFTLFRLRMFKDERFEQGAWFKTVNEYRAGVGVKAFTQDLYFFDTAGKLGYRFGCSTRVLTGHRDKKTGIIW